MKHQTDRLKTFAARFMSTLLRSEAAGGHHRETNSGTVIGQWLCCACRFQFVRRYRVRHREEQRYSEATANGRQSQVIVR